jgi:hypothetical protein
VRKTRGRGGDGSEESHDQAIRCDDCGLKMAELRSGHLVLRAKHHGETHFKIVAVEKMRGRD